MNNKFFPNGEGDFYTIAAVPSYFLLGKWIIPSICNLKLAIVQGLCYADLYYESVLEGNLKVLEEAALRAYTNLQSADKSPIIDIP